MVADVSARWPSLPERPDGRLGAAPAMSVSTVLVRVLVAAVERAGVPSADLLVAAKVDRERLADAGGRFDLREFARLQVRAMDLTGDEALGLHIAEQTTEGSFDLMAHVVAHAPTLREALGLCSQFHNILIDDSRLSVRETAETATLTCEFARSVERSDRMLAEFIVAGLHRLVQTFAGPRVAPQMASFEHELPAHHPEYTRLFGGAERFAQRTTALAFDRALLDRAHLHQHPELYSMLRAEAERALKRVTLGLRPSEQLRQYLLARPASRIPDMATAARDLRVSERSLRRQLASENTSYRELVRATLEASARHMLRDPARSIKETAAALGFVDARTFHRAFKRWTGMTPMEYRQTREGD
jgi:AraC-like DNA-binding protein